MEDASFPPGRILVDRDLRALGRTAVVPAPADDQLQPASVDLRLGAQAFRVPPPQHRRGRRSRRASRS